MENQELKREIMLLLEKVNDEKVLRRIWKILLRAIDW